MEYNLNDKNTFKYASHAYAMLRNKQRAIAKYTKQNQVWEKFISILEQTIPIIESFDNKQLNRRLMNAIKEQVLPKEKYYISNYYAKNCYTITTQDRLADYKEIATFIDVNTVSFNIAMYNDSKCIDANTTINDIQRCISTIKAKIVEYTKSIDNYNTYIQRTIDIENAIHSYKMEIPTNIQAVINVANSPYF